MSQAGPEAIGVGWRTWALSSSARVCARCLMRGVGGGCGALGVHGAPGTFDQGCECFPGGDEVLSCPVLALGVAYRVGRVDKAFDRFVELSRVGALGGWRAAGHLFDQQPACGLTHGLIVALVLGEPGI